MIARAPSAESGRRSPLAEALEARRQVHAVANETELHPRGAADVPRQHRAADEAHPRADVGLPTGRARARGRRAMCCGAARR